MQKTDQEDKTKSVLKKAGRVGLTILNPLSDLGVIYRNAFFPMKKNLDRMKALLQGNAQEREKLNWAEAVAITGQTAEELMVNFKRIRVVWWVLMATTGMLAIFLILLLLSANDLPQVTSFRSVTATLALMACTSIGFVKTLITTYRLWQLKERRVSEREKGTFQNFLAENNWVQQVLFLKK